MPRLQFKFRSSTEEGLRQALCRALLHCGALDVHPFFPDDSEPQLASLYVVEYARQQDEEPLAAWLEEQPMVEFVERLNLPS